MSGAYAITNVLVADDGAYAPATVTIRGGVIDRIVGGGGAPSADYEVFDGGGAFLSPGLIDVHVHGGGGFDLMSGDPEQVRGYANWIAKRGITGFLVSTSGRDHADILARLRAIAPVIGREPGAARVLGFHLEGPYINPVRKGAFPPRWLRTPSVREYEELFEAAHGHILQMTIAPELPGALDLIDAVVRSGAVAAIGHTDATYDEAMRGIDRGATHVTHCFNAMRPFGHRDPGVLGAVMTSDKVTVELIGDGAHVDYAAAQVLVRAKKRGGVVLITDGMPLAGTQDGEAEWEGQAIRVDGGKAVRVTDGTIIGGVITLDQTVRNGMAHLWEVLERMEDPHWRLRMAVDAASAEAARAMNLGRQYGAITPGAVADFVLHDTQFNVRQVWIAGERVTA